MRFWILASDCRGRTLKVLAGNRKRGATRNVGKILYYLGKNPLTVTGFVIIALLVFTALCAPWIAPYPDQGIGKSNIPERLQPPGKDHILGTDDLGRDILSRIIFGSRVALKSSFIVILFVVGVGTPLGIIAGYFGGKIDEIIMRVCDLVLAFPSLLLALAIVAAIGPGLQNALLALSVPWWPWYTRLARNETLSLKSRSFVEAARGTGVSDAVIMFKHILPNCLTPIVVQATLDMGYIILMLAGLGFLGLGTQPPAPDWGVMIGTGRIFILDQWWVSTFPGAAIFISVLGFNLVGDGISEAANPKRHR